MNLRLRLVDTDVATALSQLRTNFIILLNRVAPDTSIRVSRFDDGFSVVIHEIDGPGDGVQPSPLRASAVQARLRHLGPDSFKRSRLEGDKLIFTAREIADPAQAARTLVAAAYAVGVTEDTIVDGVLEDIAVVVAERLGIAGPTPAAFEETIDGKAWTYSQPVLVVQAQSAERRALIAADSGDAESAQHEAAEADRLYRAAIGEGAEWGTWTREDTVVSYAGFLARRGDGRAARDLLAPYVEDALRRGVVAKAWGQSIELHSTNNLDAKALLQLLDGVQPHAAANGLGRTVGSLLLEIAYRAEYRERKAAELNPAVAGTYAEPLLRGLSTWADRAADKALSWRMRSELGRYLEKVDRLGEARACFEGIVADGGVTDLLAVDRLSLILERAKDFAGATALIDRAVAAGLDLRRDFPRSEPLEKRLARCRAKVAGLAASMVPVGGIAFVAGESAVDVVHKIAFKGSPRIDAGQVVHGVLWLYGERCGERWAARVDHRGDGTWEEVAHTEVPPRILATRPDGFMVCETRPPEHPSLMADRRLQTDTTEVLLAVAPDGSIAARFPGGPEVVPGLGGWCVRDARGGLRAYSRDGVERFVLPLRPRPRDGWWGGGSSLVATEAIAVCSERTDLLGAGPDGGILWRVARRSYIDDVACGDNCVVVLSDRLIEWYDFNGRRLRLEGLHSLARMFIRDINGRPIAVLHDRDHATLLESGRQGGDVRVPVLCPEWWGWRGGLLAQHSITLFAIDSRGAIRLHATFPRRLNMVVRDNEFLVCVLNPLFVLRPHWLGSG